MEDIVRFKDINKEALIRTIKLLSQPQPIKPLRDIRLLIVYFRILRNLNYN